MNGGQRRDLDEPERRSADWIRYVEDFHTTRAGVTERLLQRCTHSAGGDPYAWVIQDLGERGDGPVIDVGCGSGPSRSAGERWIGVDRSTAELHAAVEAGRVPVVAGDARALPLAPGCAQVALSAMSLMVVDDPAAALAEVARVVRPGGTLRVLVPVGGPLPPRDRLRYGLLLLVLGRTAVPFPRPEVVSDPLLPLRKAAMEVIEDDRRCFRFPLRGDHDAELFVDSLYLPDMGARRLSLARWMVRRWARARQHHDIGIPLRRISARVPGSALQYR